MGRESDAIQGYLNKKEYFADFFNGCYFHGERVVQPDALEEASEVYNQKHQENSYQGFVRIKRGKDEKKNTATRMRDLKKRLRSGESLRILAIEHQSKINYIMPWRHMYYDALEYGKQVEELSSKNKSEKCLKTDEEFLSGLKESDRLAPVFTACLYLGTEPWTGPRNLKEMMDFGRDETWWKELFVDYQLNLICVNEMTDFSAFHSQLKLLLMLLAYREDKEKMQNEIENNPEFAAVDRETAYVAGVLLGNELFMEEYIEEEGEEINMCGALKAWREEDLARGRAEGRAEGRGILNSLNQRLSQDNRIDDLIKASGDIEYQNRLLQEYGLLDDENE